MSHSRSSPDRPAPADHRAPWRVRLGDLIFNNDTPLARLFDLGLTVLIVASVGVVMLESVSRLQPRYGALLRTLEWTFTALFTLEYVARLIGARRALHYARSFFGIVDLLSILPGLLGLLLPGSQALSVVRALRLLRIFRILKLARYLDEASLLSEAVRRSAAKITVFLVFVLTVVILVGSLMYLIEGPQNGYTSIPTSIYWAIVTVTTVGYGDIAPKTDLGKFLASATMILGYGILAVPTGIVTVSLGQAHSERQRASRPGCPRCGLEGLDSDARYCKRCGQALEGEPQRSPDPARA